MALRPGARLISALQDPLQFFDAAGYCSVCGHRGHLWSHGIQPQRRCLCPGCLSQERHRLFVLCFDDLQLWPEGDVLHFAPEPQLGELLRRKARRYVTADYEAGVGDLTENIEALSFEDDSWDMIIANHVFEHLQNDAPAFREIFRVLRPGGQAVLSVPLVHSWERTYENPDITSPEDRVRHFGQDDHMRWYGRDFVGRFKAPGFSVSAFTSPPDKVYTHGLLRHDAIFIGRKPA